MTRTVTIDTATTGTNFALIGIVRDARTGRKLASTSDCYPFANAAVTAAVKVAAARGWTILDDEDDQDVYAD